MSIHVRRSLVLLLIPCLAGEPGLGSALDTNHSVICVYPQSAFTEQAFMLPVVADSGAAPAVTAVGRLEMIKELKSCEARWAGIRPLDPAMHDVVLAHLKNVM